MKIFIGSSSEAKEQVIEIQKILEGFGVSVSVWYDSQIFIGSEYTLENLQKASENVDAALFVWASDDIVFKYHRKKASFSTRDNVIFETGLFMGKIGRRNICICKSRKTALPSDLAGFTTIDIDNNETLKDNLECWLKNTGNRPTIKMASRNIIDRENDINEQWKYAKEIIFVNYASSTFLNPRIATASVYSCSKSNLLKERLEAGTVFRFLINKPNSFAAKEAAKNKMCIMARPGIKASKIFKMSLKSLEQYKLEYPKCLEYKLTKIALPYAAMLVINDDQHRYLDNIKIDLYSPFINDRERRSFVINKGDANYDFFFNNIEKMWTEAGK